MSAEPVGSRQITHRLAVYDMDLTITSRASWNAWLVHWAVHEAPWRLLLVPLILGPVLAYGLGCLDRKRLKELSHRLFIGRAVDAARLDARARTFARDFGARTEREDALACIAADRAQGFRILLATASSDYYARHLAARWGVFDVIATRNKTGEGTVLHQIDGPNCYGADKLALVEAWCARQGIAPAQAEIRAYSDHQADVPLLAWADAPVVVRPKRRMAALAAQRGWPVRPWR
jgi:HAD superfamily phosphoserine phosphatase-like hydrolase